MEALTLGCRIITNLKGGIPEQIRGFEGILLVDSHNVKLNKVIEFMNDSKVRYDRSEEYKKRFGCEKFIKEFESVLEEVKQCIH
jgi:glycosyltransferase involved in cell wall biosynthesis